VGLSHAKEKKTVRSLANQNQNQELASSSKLAQSYCAKANLNNPVHKKKSDYSKRLIRNLAKI
jgi:hypothetical protein